jgi:RND family efflux transporter MFP subunit
MKRKVIVVIGLVLAVGLLTLYLSHRQKTTVRANVAPLVSVEVISPATTKLHREVEVFGSLAARSSTEVRNEIAGRVVRVNAKDWDQVTANFVLVELEPTDARLAVNRADAGLKMSRAQVLKARVDLSQAQREWNRAQKLKEGGLITGKELDDRQSGLESARALVGLAEAQMAQTESQLAEARHNLDKAMITAPIDGAVCQRSVDVGDYVKEGSLLFMVVDNRLLDFTASVASGDLSQVVEGLRLTFTVDGVADRTFEGWIKRVNPVVSSSER